MTEVLSPNAAPTPDTDAAIQFLKQFAPNGPWILAAIKPEGGGPEVKTFGPDTEAKARSWVEKHNGQRNLYFQVNLSTGNLSKKASKTDIKSVTWLHVDIDPRAGDDLSEEQERIGTLLAEKRPKGVPEPTCVIFSGGGYQAFWRLEVPLPIDGELERATEAERYNKQLEALFDADSCHNVDHIMRLPGTVNLPNERKRKKGRVPVRARLEDFNEDLVYAIDQFGQAPADGPKAPTTESTVRFSGEARRIADLSELDKWNVPERLKEIIQNGGDPENTKAGDNSRSAWLFDVLCGLLRQHVPEEVVFGIITDEKWAISESVLEQGGRARAYALRQIDRASDRVKQDFQVNEKGVPFNSQHNIMVALNRMEVELSHDQFADRLIVKGLAGHGPVLQDEAVTELYLTIDTKFGFRPGKDFFWMVVETAARRDGFNPVVNYLSALRWDGTPRVDTWLSAYCGAQDSKYTRAVGGLPLLAAVRRVRSPGCKFDEMLVLRSPQGTGKSTALALLCPTADWFSDDLPLGADTKVAIERLQGRWIVEAAELTGLRNNRVEQLKAFLSRQVDRARLAYGRITSEVPRQCIFVGTTNSERFLRDSTGDRRFWPVAVGEFDLVGLKRDRDQLWAEAAHREAQGETIRLDPSLYPAATENQDDHRIEDPYETQLAAVLGEVEGKLRNIDAWQIIGVPSGQRTQDHNERLGASMRRLGWERVKRRFGGTPEWCYVRGRGSLRQLEVELVDGQVILAPVHVPF